MSNRFNSLPKASSHTAEEAATYSSAEDQERYEAWLTESYDGQDQDALYQETIQLRLLDDYNTMKDSILNGSIAAGTGERTNPKGRQAFYLANEIRKARLRLGDADTQSEEYLQLVTSREDKLEAILSRSEEAFRPESNATRSIDNLSDEEADFIIDYSGGKYDAILESSEDNSAVAEQDEPTTQEAEVDESQATQQSENASEKQTENSGDETPKQASSEVDAANVQRIDMNAILRSARGGGEGNVTRDEAEAILTRLRAALDGARKQKSQEQPAASKAQADKPVREGESIEEYEARQEETRNRSEGENPQMGIDDDVEPLHREASRTSIDDDVEPLRRESASSDDIDDDVESLKRPSADAEGIDDNVESLKSTTTWRSRLADIFNPRNAKENAKKLARNVVGGLSQLDKKTKETIKEHPKAAVALGVVAIAGIWVARREFSDAGNTFATGTYESGGFEDQLADGTITMDSGLEGAGDTVDAQVDNNGSTNTETDSAAGEAAETGGAEPTSEIDAMVDSLSVEAKTVVKGEGGFETLDQMRVPQAQQEAIWEQIGNELTDTGQGDLVYRNDDDENRWGWNKSLVLSDKAQRTIAEVIRRNQ